MEKLGEILSRSANGASSLRALPDGAAEPAGQVPDEPDACPRCGGAGFVRRALPLDHPRFGRAEPCACVLAEDAEARQERLTRLSNLDHLSRFTFDALASPGGDARRVQALAAAREYAEEPEGWLVVTGPSGSGKTVLAAAVANRRVELGRPALFMVVPDLLDHLRSAYSARGDDLSYDELADQVRNSPFLVLDDVDAASPTDWAREKLFQLVNHRQAARLPTVVTCATVEGLDQRLVTRLSSAGNRTVELAPPAVGSAYAQVGGMTRERLELMTFANFDLRGAGLQPEERESLQAAYRATRAFAEEPHGFLTLLGVNGCGKTHLAAAAANRVLADGRSVFFAVVPDLLDHLRASFAPGREALYDETFDRIRAADLLVLDDLGSQASSPWAQEKLFQVVNYRTVSGLATVVTSDRDIEQIRSVHPRIAARIFDPRVGVAVGLLAPHYSLGRAAAEGRARRRPG